MAQSNPNLTSIFTDVANAIRQKTGDSAAIHPVDFADEIIAIPTGGGDQPQLHSVTALSQSAGIATWSGDSYVESYKLYLDGMLVDTVTAAYYDITSLTISIGSHTFGVAAAATNFVDATAAIIAFGKRSITVNITNGTASGPSTMYSWDAAQFTITLGAGMNAVTINSVTNATYSFNSSTNILTLTNPTDNIVVDIECKYIENYIIGFTGMSQYNPTLTRTDSAVGATWAASNGVIEVSGIDMTKIWGGYEGNDGEQLTWDSINSKYLYNGEEYTGNVFSKLNRFFIKPSYVVVNNEQVLDGFQLCYSDEKPDATWQDWFYGKDHVSIGCYKAKNVTSASALTSVKGIAYSSACNANDIVAAYKLNSTASGNLHEKWFNENAILQVLFMAIFATRQTEDVFPQGTYRNYNDSKQTGYLDGMRTSSAIATGYATSYSSSANGNMFLGIEDFVGFGFELVAGVVLSGTNVRPTIDYANFSYSGSYSNADINLSGFTSGQYVKSLQISATTVGLLIPKTGTGDTSTSTTYFCDKCWTGQNCWYQGAYDPTATFGVFSADCYYDSSRSRGDFAARLCRTPV